MDILVELRKNIMQKSEKKEWKWIIYADWIPHWMFHLGRNLVVLILLEKELEMKRNFFWNIENNSMLRKGGKGV